MLQVTPATRRYVETSVRKIEANRLNALRSTGPRTPAGKAASGRNAVTHGLYCRDLLLPGEDAGELAGLRDGLVADLRPRGAAQELVVEQLVAAAWRLRRGRAAEARLLGERAAGLRAAAMDASAAAAAGRAWAGRVAEQERRAPRRPLLGPPPPPPDPADFPVASAAALAALFRSGAGDDGDDDGSALAAGHAAAARAEERLLRTVHRCLRELRLLRKDARELAEELAGDDDATVEPVEPVEPAGDGAKDAEDAMGAGVGEEAVAAASPGRNEAAVGDGDVQQSAADAVIVRNEPTDPPPATPTGPSDPLPGSPMVT